MSSYLMFFPFTVLSMTQRTVFVCLFVLLLFVGCKNNTDTSPVEAQDVGLDVPGALPLPDAKELEALGPLNNLDTQWLLSDSVFVASGQPCRFLASSLGRENTEIINGTLFNFLQIPLEYNDIDRFVVGMSLPNRAVVEVMERDVKVAHSVPLHRRVTVLTFVAPIFPEDFLKRLFYMPQLTPQQFAAIPRRKVGSREVFDLTPPNLAIPQKRVLFFADDKTVVFVDGDEPAIQEAFSVTPPRGAAIERIRRTDVANNDLVLVLSREGIPSDTAADFQSLLQLSGVPEERAISLAAGFRAATVRANVLAEVGSPLLVANIEMTTTNDAQEVFKTFDGNHLRAQTELMSMGAEDKNFLPVPPDFAFALLNSLTIEAVGARIDATVTKFADFDVIAAKGLNDEQTQMRERRELQERFGQLSFLAGNFNAYYQANHKYPTSILAEDGTPLLSWRVALLPTIGQEALYRRFKLDEPWDSPTNKPLLDEMPPVFTALSPSVEKNKTIVRYFDSEGTPFANRNLKREDLKTPQSTLLLVNVVPEKAVEWTKPDPLEFDVPKIEETVGDVLIGISFNGQSIPPLRILPLSDPRSVSQRELITVIIKGQPVPQQPVTPPLPAPPTEEDESTKTMVD